MLNKEDKDIDQMLQIAIERRDGESSRAFAAFLEYVSLVPKDRDRFRDTLPKVTQLSAATLGSYKSQFDWENRAADVDAQRWIMRERELQRLAAKDNQAFINQNKEVKANMMAISNKALTLVKEYFEQLDPKTLRPNEAANIIDKIVKNVRMVNDLPTVIVESRILSSVDLDDLSVEELELRYEKEVKEIKLLTGAQKIDQLQ